MYKPFNVDITNVASDSKQFSVRISELKMVIIVQIWRLLVVCQSKQGDRLRKAEEVTDGSTNKQRKSKRRILLLIPLLKWQ